MGKKTKKEGENTKIRNLLGKEKITEETWQKAGGKQGRVT